MRYFRVYWDADNVSLPKSPSGFDEVFTALRGLYEKLGYWKSDINFQLKVVCNASTKSGIREDIMHRLDNHCCVMQVVGSTKEVSDAIELHVKLSALI